MGPLSDDVELNDETKVKDLTWRVLKEHIMQEDYTDLNYFVSYFEFYYDIFHL